MAPLTPAEKDLLPDLVIPFERSDKPPEEKVLKDGEVEYDEFTEFIHIADNNGEPNGVVCLTKDEIKIIKNKGRFQEKCYLWIIDENIIKLVREKTRNVKRTHKPQFVCHTNLTGGEKARIGGEMFFCKDKTVYINPFSDRYGGTKNITNAQWKATKQYFIKVGYTKLIDILELLGIELRDN